MSITKNKYSWEYRAVYHDFTGKRKIKHKSGFKTKKEAKIAEAEFLENREAGNIGSMTFGQLYKLFLDDKKGKLKDSSIVSINNKIKKHVLPYFENRKVNDLSVNDIRLWQKELQKDNKYSLAYLQSIHARLSSVLAFGVKYYSLQRNVAQLNGNFSDSSYVKQEMDFYTYDEWKQFEAALPEGDYKAFFQFLYWTGCRRGEAQALNWNDIEQDFNYVRISKTLSSKITGQNYQITPPKTVTSNRRVSIPNCLKDVLKAKYEHDNRIEGFKRSCFIFGVSKPLSDESLRRYKNKACKDAGLREIRIHDFRHSHCSFLFSKGIDVTVVSKRLGHGDINITMKTYIHMLPEKEDEALKILNNFN